jgi:hypothetical protein
VSYLQVRLEVESHAVLEAVAINCDLFLQCTLIHFNNHWMHFNTTYTQCSERGEDSDENAICSRAFGWHFVSKRLVML